MIFENTLFLFLRTKNYFQFFDCQNYFPIFLLWKIENCFQKLLPKKGQIFVLGLSKNNVKDKKVKTKNKKIKPSVKKQLPT